MLLALATLPSLLAAGEMYGTIVYEDGAAQWSVSDLDGDLLLSFHDDGGREIEVETDFFPFETFESRETIMVLTLRLGGSPLDEYRFPLLVGDRYERGYQIRNGRRTMGEIRDRARGNGYEEFLAPTLAVLDALVEKRVGEPALIPLASTGGGSRVGFLKDSDDGWDWWSIAGSALAGAAGGAAAGAIGGALIGTISTAGVGAGPGALIGAVAGAVGGAVTGAINEALEQARESGDNEDSSPGDGASDDGGANNEGGAGTDGGAGNDGGTGGDGSTGGGEKNASNAYQTGSMTGGEKDAFTERRPLLEPDGRLSLLHDDEIGRAA